MPGGLEASGTEEAGETNSPWAVFAGFTQAAGYDGPAQAGDPSSEFPIQAEGPDSAGGFSGRSGFAQDMPGKQGPASIVQGGAGDSLAATAGYVGQIGPQSRPREEAAGEQLSRNAYGGPLSYRHGQADAAEGRAHSPLARYAGTEYPPAMLRQDYPADGEGEDARFSRLRGRSGRPVFEFRDFRTAEAQNAASPGGEASRAPGLDAFRPLGAEVELPVGLKLSLQNGSAQAAGTASAEFSQSQLFEDALARELRGNLSADIVKNATLIVRNGGEGTIRLALHPASLGHVKIHLEMTENKITGRIIVESGEALRAFQKELPVLEKAFKDSGFMDASLEMTLTQDGSDFGSGQRRQDGDLPALEAAHAASRYDTGTEQAWMFEDAPSLDTALAAGGQGRKTVNIFV